MVKNLANINIGDYVVYSDYAQSFSNPINTPTKVVDVGKTWVELDIIVNGSWKRVDNWVVTKLERYTKIEKILED